VAPLTPSVKFLPRKEDASSKPLEVLQITRLEITINNKGIITPIN
jgi:hypothetical protein